MPRRHGQLLAAGAFDPSEYASGDFTAVVKDQNGNGIKDVTVHFHESFVSFDGTYRGRAQLLGNVAANGTADIPFTYALAVATRSLLRRDGRALRASRPATRAPPT